MLLKKKRCLSILLMAYKFRLMILIFKTLMKKILIKKLLMKKILMKKKIEYRIVEYKKQLYINPISSDS